MSSALVAHSLYYYVVLNMGNPFAVLDIPPSFALENAVVTVIVIISQCFYVQQIFRLSHSKVIAVAIILSAIASFSIGMEISVYLFQNPNFLALDTQAFKIRAILVQSFAAFCDIGIAAAMCYYLHGQKTVFRKTQALINTLIVYAVSRGVLTAICQILFDVLFAAAPLQFTWMPFHEALAKLYVNSILMTLNVREALRSSGPEVVATTLHLSDLSSTNPASARPASRSEMRWDKSGLTQGMEVEVSKEINVV